MMTCVGFLFVFSCQLPAAVAPPVVCPPVRTWSRDFQQQVAAELKAAPNSALGKIAIQAIGDRDIARACARLQHSK
jgi:hypothetical protein